MTLLVDLTIRDTLKVAAVTANISRHGALILSPVPAPFPSVISIHNRHTGLEATARLVRPAERTAAGQYALGVELLDERADEFWGPAYVWTLAQ
jgi:hypothetical protein